MEFPKSLHKFKRDGIKSKDSSLQFGDYVLNHAVRDFYEMTNGMTIKLIDTDILSIDRAIEYGHKLGFHPLSRYFGLLPFTDSDDSNPYCLILGQKLNGAVLQVVHDDTSYVTHSSLPSFLDAVASLVENQGDIIDDLLPENIGQERLIREADSVIDDCLGDDDLEESVMPAVLPVCSEQKLISLIDHPDMWIREEAAIQAGNKLFLEARAPLKKLAEAGNRQDSRAAQKSLSILNREYYKDKYKKK